MISSTVIKISAPFARSSLVFISVGLLATSAAIIHYAAEYPYLFGHETEFDDFYIQQSKSIPVTLTVYSVVGILVALSTLYASYRGTAGYTLGHAGFIGIFVPALIAAYFLTRVNRHNPEAFIDDGFVLNYRIDNQSTPTTYRPPEGPNKYYKEKINGNSKLVDLLQEVFACCGVRGAEDWTDAFDKFIPASCCKSPPPHQTIIAKDKPEWKAKWIGLNDDFPIEYCDPELTRTRELPGCREAIKEFEDDKNTRLGLLTGLFGILCIANGVLSLLTYALIHTEHECKFEETELTVMSDDQAQDPRLNSLKPRPSIASGTGNETIAARALAVRFNLSNSPRQSISGPSKFSLAARRHSSWN